MTTRGGYDTEALEEILGEMVDKHKCGCYVEGEWFVYDPKPYGYLYCFSNPSMEGILKIGMTKRNPDERLKEANKSDTWKPPTDYELLYSVKCYEPEKKEKLLHKLLDEYRINKNREFFRVDEEKVNIIFKMLDIEYFEDKYECRDNKIKTEKEEIIIKKWESYVMELHKDNNYEALFERTDIPDEKTIKYNFEFWCKHEEHDYKKLSKNKSLITTIERLIREFEKTKRNNLANWIDENIIECEEFTSFDDLYDNWGCYCDDQVGLWRWLSYEKREIKEILLEMQSKTVYGLILGKKRSDGKPNGTKQKPKFNFKIKEDKKYEAEEYEAEEYEVDGVTYMKIWDDEDKMWIITDPESGEHVGFPDGNGGIRRRFSMS